MPTTYAIIKGSDYFDATLWTGNGSSQSITNSGSMQPDFLWYKDRSAASDHRLFDSVRGVTKALYSDATDAEATEASALTSFNSNGFTLGSGSGNTSTRSFVGWQWRASNATGVTNTAGSITSTVSANTTSGFSIVTWTGNGTLGATIGHGLGVAPKMIIFKKRSAVEGWPVYTATTGNTGYTLLNATDAFGTQSAFLNNTSPTSSVITLGNWGAVNGSGATYVAYCWSEVAGFSKFGSYTGNLSTDGPFVYLGFRPRYLMVKNSSGTQDWTIVDSSRSTYNITYNDLYANQSLAEQTDQLFDFTSNGFKVRGANNATNASGGTIIYMAFAEVPFKYANAR